MLLLHKSLRKLQEFQKLKGTRTKKCYKKICCYSLHHSGSYKDFRSSVPGTGNEDQIYIYLTTVCDLLDSQSLNGSTLGILGKVVHFCKRVFELGVCRICLYPLVFSRMPYLEPLLFPTAA